MAELNPDPGPAQPGSIVVLSAESWNALRDAAKPLRGVAEQVEVIALAGGGLAVGFASERLVTIVQNGNAVDVFIPIRTA